MKQDHHLNYSRVAYSLLLSLLLQGCDNPSNQFIPKSGEVTDEALATNKHISSNYLDQEFTERGMKKRNEHQEGKEKGKEKEKSLIQEKEGDSSKKVTLEDLPEEILSYLMDFEGVRRCLVPNNYISKKLIIDKKGVKKLWDNYYISAPQQRRKLVDKYSYQKKV